MRRESVAWLPTFSGPRSPSSAFDECLPLSSKCCPQGWLRQQWLVVVSCRLQVTPAFLLTTATCIHAFAAVTRSWKPARLTTAASSSRRAAVLPSSYVGSLSEKFKIYTFVKQTHPLHSVESWIRRGCWQVLASKASHEHRYHRTRRPRQDHPHRRNH